MEANNFKRLMWQEEKENPPPKEIEENIFKNLHILELFGETMELYLPHAAEMFIDLLGGSIDGNGGDDLPPGGHSEGDNNPPPPMNFE